MSMTVYLELLGRRVSELIKKKKDTFNVGSTIQWGQGFVLKTCVMVVMKSLIIITEYFHSTCKHSSPSLHFWLLRGFDYL